MYYFIPFFIFDYHDKLINILNKPPTNSTTNKFIGLILFKINFIYLAVNIFTYLL